MTLRFILFFTCLVPFLLVAQEGSSNSYEASQEFPFGRLNPKAPPETADFSDLIGRSDCISETRQADRTWAKPVKMTWEWKYIMNGMGVQDETIKADGKHSGSIRQYSRDSARWYVHYYSSAAIATTLSTWEGTKKGKDIVLYRAQKAPNGMDGFYRLTFSNIHTKGFNWIGEWVDTTEKVVFPTWKIACTKRED